MSASYTSGIDLPYQSINAGVIPNSVFWLGINYYADRCPLISRLSKLPIGSPSFYMNNDNYRPRTSTLAGAYTSTASTLTVSDSSLYTVGDVLAIDNERFLVTAINNASTITVTYAFEGSTNANHNNNSVVTLITNARNGGAIDQSGLNRIPVPTLQNVQTVQHPYQVGGAFQATSAFMGGAVSPLARARMLALQHAMDDMESAMCFGKGQAITSTVDSPTQKGLQTLLTTNSVTSPTNATAYKPSDLIRDVLKTSFAKGGRPNMLLVAPNWMVGFATWGFNLQLIKPNTTELGIPVTTFFVPWLPGVEIVPSPIALPDGTAIAINTDEVRMRVRRPLFDQPRGLRGDAFEGDIIFDAAIEVENEYHHVYLSGVTGFAVQS